MSWAAPWTTTGKDQHKEKVTSKTNSKTHSRRLAEARAAAEHASHDIPATFPETAPTQDDKHRLHLVHSDDVESENDSDNDSVPSLVASDSDCANSVHADDADSNDFEHDSNDGEPGPHDNVEDETREDSDDKQSPQDNVVKPEQLWSTLPSVTATDHYGLNRCPATWYTLNYPYNYSFELHRFHRAIAEIHNEDSEESFPDISSRCQWVLDNPDIVAVLHAIGVEMCLRQVMPHIIPCTKKQPFQYWLRFEWGKNGNPHCHGQGYTAENPTFENITLDAETKKQLIEAGFPDARNLKLKEECESDLGNYFSEHIKEWHPAKDAGGNQLYPFRADLLQNEDYDKPQTVDLLDFLEDALADDKAVDLNKLRRLLLALIEDGQRHTMHGHNLPTHGQHPCARLGRTSTGKQYIYCRYLFPKALLVLDWDKLALVTDDPHRPHLRNLLFARNDTLINSYSEELLLDRYGNIDYRALLNLWSVLEYLTKYNTKAGVGSKRIGKVLEDVMSGIFEWEQEDGVHDLWRRAIMKVYSRILGGRDYSLFETLHFGLRLPGTLSSFGDVSSIPISDWAPLKRGKALKHTRADERATYRTKIEIFDDRQRLERSPNIAETDLHDISLYAFWRMFDVQKSKIVKKKRERIIALHGLGWPGHAKTTHDKHAEYAKKTLIAYMPCPRDAGTSYIHDMVSRYFHNDWRRALRKFVLDPTNKWCPSWVARNYEVQNEVLRGFPHEQMPLPDLSQQDAPDDSADLSNGKQFPHQRAFPTKFIFSGEAPMETEDADDEGTDDKAAEHAEQTRWDNENRPAWERHSEKGPNLAPQGYRIPREVLPEVVNPLDYDYESRSEPLRHEFWDHIWETLATNASIYEDKSLTKESLGDDYQLLFVNMLLQHVQTLIEYAKADSLSLAKPLRVFLLGTAGTGKTRTVQTTLQEIRNILNAHGLPAEFVRCAAPTGTAAFTLKFNATTVHRLIKWFNLRAFSEINNDDVLSELQTHLQHTQIVFLDEISMIGRKMMGRIDSRLRQGKAIDSSTTESLGNVSCVGIGDPAQCEAMGDDQFYDERPRQDTTADEDCTHTRLSNIGLSVYAEFDEVIILTHVHRMSHIEEPKDATDIEYNNRATQYWDIMHRLRDYNMTLEDYYWLCKRKQSKLSLSERTFFQDAPILMDLRRMTEKNPEANCDFYNQSRLRSFAKEKKLPVIAFDAQHENVSQHEGMQADDAKFMGLSKRLEFAIGAIILLILNLAVDSGLMNGSQGTIVDIIYAKGHHPNHDDPTKRMPSAIIVEFPQYIGPAFFTEKAKWVPIRPVTRNATDDSNMSRRQFPLILAFALTPWKAQGMTLVKMKLQTDKAASSPGVLFSALTRIRHPDTIMFTDHFPSYAQIMKARSNPGFKMRQAWERKARAKFSRTIRKHMQDATVYSPSKVWTSEQSYMADKLIQHYGTHTDVTIDDLPEHFLEEVSGNDQTLVQNTWAKMQTFPHCFEIAEARNALHTLHLDGTPRDTYLAPTTFSDLSHEDWTVPIDAMENFSTLGVIVPSIVEFLAHSFRQRLTPTKDCFLRHDVLRSRKMSLIMKTQRRRSPQPLPARTFIPYISESKYWSLFVLTREQDADTFQLRCYFAHGSKTEAFESTVRYLQHTFKIQSPIIEQSTDDTLGDGILFAFFFAAFLDEPLENAHTAASTCITQAQDLCENILREATTHNEPNINIIFARNQELRTAFYDLFPQSSQAFAQATRAYGTSGSGPFSRRLAQSHQSDESTHTQALFRKGLETSRATTRQRKSGQNPRSVNPAQCIHHFHQFNLRLYHRSTQQDGSQRCLQQQQSENSQNKIQKTNKAEQLRTHRKHCLSSLDA